MTTAPIDAARLALQDAEAALARLRPALAAAYGLAGENLTKAADQLDVAERAQAAAERRAETAEEDAEIHRANHQAACRTIAEMHEAATGRTGMGPIRGVVEDVADVRARAEQAEQALAEAERRIGILDAVDAGRAHGARRIMRERDQAQQRAERAEADMKEIAEAYERHRRTLAAVFARSAETPFEEITEYAARTINRTGARLAAAEEVRAEAERVADRATQTLLRIKHARTAADAWTALGTHYHLPVTEAGRRARDWRSTAERDAAKRAETASALGARYMGDAERFHAAWHSARERAQRTASELRVVQASRRRWKRRAKTAEQALADIRIPGPVGRDHPMYALTAAMVGPGISRAEARQHIANYFNAITGREQ
ncbi:hypothetical protein [Streptomyces cyaneofuscatus]|uniref:hypothetical protein n=1 Tax=Streptomyces cyaneofuscatus TaxID=66883 RepID=UPI003660DCE4